MARDKQRTGYEAAAEATSLLKTPETFSLTSPPQLGQSEPIGNGTAPAQGTAPEATVKRPRRVRSKAWKAMTRIEDLLADMPVSEANRVIAWFRAMPFMEPKDAGTSQ